MSALKITNRSALEDSYSISFQLDSSYIPYGMQENFIIMEKTPDYLFHYISLFFYEQKLQNSYELNLSQKSLGSDITEITIDTNHRDFFNIVDNILTTTEIHFSIVCDNFNDFNSVDTFSNKLNKLKLFDKLSNDFTQTDKKIKKNKI